MLTAFRKLFRPAAAPAPIARVPEGERVYAVGDIHGCLALLEALAAAIEAEDAALPPARTTVILLGDLVDRGPDSAGVIEFARAWQARRKVRILAGNHEEMFLESFDSTEVLRQFLRHGGRETVLSYPVDPEVYFAAELAETQALMRAAVPEADREFLRGFEDAIRIGDYLFVHAGVRPDLPLDAQRPGDLRWIREPFLSHAGDLGAVVVHGHTIFDAVSLAAHRIGIDTGAYASGRLTALGLEGGQRWLLTAQASGDEAGEGAIAVNRDTIT